MYSIIQKVKDEIFSKRQSRKYKTWPQNGCPVPPPHQAKQKVVKEYQKKYGFKTFIETGTFKGDMIKAILPEFDKIISVELGNELYKKAVRRFKNEKKVKIIHGDSGKVLHHIMPEIHEPAIFWLDGHYSGGQTAKGEKECPIFDELEAILKNNNLNHVLLIDDARHFTGQNDYPTIKELSDFVNLKNDRYKVDVEHDIIRMVI